MDNPFTQDLHRLDDNLVISKQAGMFDWLPWSEKSKREKYEKAVGGPENAEVIESNIRNRIQNNFTRNIYAQGVKSFNNMSTWEKLKLAFSEITGRFLDTFGFDHNLKGIGYHKRQAVADHLNDKFGINLKGDLLEQQLGTASEWENPEKAMERVLNDKDSVLMRSENGLGNILENTEEQAREAVGRMVKDEGPNNIRELIERQGDTADEMFDRKLFGQGQYYYDATQKDRPVLGNKPAPDNLPEVEGFWGSFNRSPDLDFKTQDFPSLQQPDKSPSKSKNPINT